MEEEVNESANNLEVADQEEVVENTTSPVEESTETTEQSDVEKGEKTTEQTEEAQAETKAVQSDEDNSKFRLARIKAEKEAEKKIEQVRKEAYEQGLKQGKVETYIGRQNPYTGETIKDNFDVQEYLDMFDLDSKGEDPISGYRELQKQKLREEAEQRIKADEEAKQKQWYQNDTKEFLEKYSSDKLQELMKDKDFDLFANGKIGKVPLSQIYEDYQKLIGKYEKKSVETAKQIVANNSTTPGALEEGEPQTIDWNNMSDKEFEKYLRKAKDGELK
ncbi:MAG: hypothetical protein II625_01840 [Bacilli bacterium]|nr:hypothetical protein [Bacilli bacterium]